MGSASNAAHTSVAVALTGIALEVDSGAKEAANTPSSKLPPVSKLKFAFDGCSGIAIIDTILYFFH
jgi:hypothetical protein